MIGIIDPPREGVKTAIETCKRAGINVVMITGDHILTAKAIAKDIGILENSDFAITGDELDAISDSELEKNILTYSVFARVSPEHKVRIVKAYQSTKSIVAMTGDGVNDAPALKNADIGISMGLNGTDVAKSASDMVLSDDNFITIIDAIRAGRKIFGNIKRAIQFLLATNVAEAIPIFLGLLLGFASPLSAIQLIWLNMVTDAFPTIGLGFEPEDKNIMDLRPREPNKSIFADGLARRIIIDGIILGVFVLIAFIIGNNLYGLMVGRTMAFMTLGFVEVLYSFSVKSKKSILKAKLFNNKYLNGAIILGLFSLIVVVYTPLSKYFDAVSLDVVQLTYVVVISIIAIVVLELQKLLIFYRFCVNIVEN